MSHSISSEYDLTCAERIQRYVYIVRVTVTVELGRMCIEEHVFWCDVRMNGALCV
jgi:hypothetical protein